MKKRRLKKFVLPTLYLMIMAFLFISISFLSVFMDKKVEYKNMAVNAIRDDGVPVVNVVTTQEITKPFIDERVSVDKTYYDLSDNEGKQENSLIYYEKTYLQNSGTLYSSNDEFEIQAVLDGTVTNVDTDDILGNVVEITHNSNLKTIYYSLSDVIVNKDDKVVQGTILGKSGNNRLSTNKSNYLLFEVYYNGSTINPENFYNMKLEDLK